TRHPPTSTLFPYTTLFRSFSIRVRPREKDGRDEANEVFRRADYRRAEGSRGGSEDRRPGSPARCLGGHDLQLEVEVWRTGGVRGPAAEGAREREREAQAAAGRCDARPGCVEGSSGKKVLTPAAKREAVAHLRVCHGMSERRACRIIDVDRKSVRYRSTRADDAGLRERLRELANQRRRFGYRRLHILLRREGVMINRKKTQRLYQEEGLAVRRRRSRKRAVGTRAPAPVLALPNQRWSLDFVHDQMACGRRFRVLNIVDDVTRECLRAVPDTSISGRRVVRELTELIAERGKPGMIVSDNGTELTSNAVLAWCGQIGVEWHYIAPG